jgi:hypothetical protein
MDTNERLMTIYQNGGRWMLKSFFVKLYKKDQEIFLDYLDDLEHEEKIELWEYRSLIDILRPIYLEGEK